MKNTINPMKAIAIIAAASIVIVGGYFLGQTIFTANASSDEDMAAAIVSPSPSPIPEDTYDYSMDASADGIVGKDTSTETPEDSVAPETPQNSTAPVTKTPTAPANNGSSGTSTSSGTTSKPASTPSAAPSPTQSSGGSSGSSTPAAGSTNSSGQFYDPVFGWVTPTGGQSIPTDSDGDWNKQVGTMG